MNYSQKTKEIAAPTMKIPDNIFASEPSRHNYFLLAGDIGGTNSRLGLYSINHLTANTQEIAYKKYLNEDYLTPATANSISVEYRFEQTILSPFLRHCWSDSAIGVELPAIQDSFIVACLAIAGPVHNNQVQACKLKELELNGDDLVQRHRLSNATKSTTTNNVDPYLASIVRCQIINDFVAQGYGCLTLDIHNSKQAIEVFPNSRTKVDPNGSIVCFGAGTGLGTCHMVPKASDDASTSPSSNSSSYMCLPSEFGQVEWAPRSEQDVELWRYLKDMNQSATRVTLEDVVSGTGLANCYEFLSTHVKDYQSMINPEVHESFVKARDLRGEVVAHNAPRCKICHEAMTIVMSAYGAATGSCAMTFLPKGGIYITGGLAPNNSEWILPETSCQGDHHQQPPSFFQRAYRDKGWASSVLDDIPVFLVKEENVGLRGAVKYAQIVLF